MIETIRKVHFESPQRPIVFRVSPDLPGRVVMDVEAEWGSLSVTVVLGRDGVLEIRDVCDRILQDWFCDKPPCACPTCVRVRAEREQETLAGREKGQVLQGGKEDRARAQLRCDICGHSGTGAAPYRWIPGMEQWQCSACFWKSNPTASQDGGFLFTGEQEAAFREATEYRPAGAHPTLANDVPLNSELKDLPKEERPGMNCEICGNRAIPAYYVHATWVCEKCNPARYKGSDDDILCKVDYKKTPDYLV